MYYILRPIVDFATRSHYASMVVKGKENLPKSGAYIFAPCHQNAMMDPLLILETTRRGVWFLCRGDIFENPTIRKILTFLKIMPVYRIRDGRKAVEQDNIIFNRSRDILVEGMPLCLMAEGRHTDRHQLLPLGKGMFRIAGMAQALMGDKPLYIIPVGLDYDDYERPYSNVVINIGKPIDVLPFLQKANGVQELLWKDLRNAVAPKMQEVMFDIRSKEHYNEFATLCEMNNAAKRKDMGLCNSVYNRFVARQQLAIQYDAIEQAAASGDSDAQQQLDTLLAQASHPAKKKIPYLGIITLIAVIAAAVMFPIVRKVLLFMIAANPLPLLPTHLIARWKIKDPQFRSSINHGIRFAFGLLYIPIASIVIGCCQGWLWGLIAFATALVITRLNGPIHHLLTRH